MGVRGLNSLPPARFLVLARALPPMAGERKPIRLGIAKAAGSVRGVVGGLREELREAFPRLRRRLRP